MVVAEIPLWLVHASDSGGANGILNRNGDLSDAAGEADGKLEHAQTSLSLLQNSGKGKKCAIYSLDFNPAGTRIATCGGDGTVRIWCASALFSRKRSRFGDEGNYESSEASASEESASSDNGERAKTGDARPHTDTNSNAHTSGDTGESHQETMRENIIHDLSSFVRRKKGGEHTSPGKPPTQPTQPVQRLASPARQSSGFPGQQPQNQQQRRHLCTLSAHSGSSVLAVRFSNNGRYLASAGDDGAVCVYKKDSNGAVGNLTDQSLEHWSRIKLCRGHSLDVVGLAWAPDDSYLVSCSLDSETPIIVWNLTDLASNQGQPNILCNPYKVLGKGIHTSTVKGVTFDPAGTYLASSGDDPAICIWRAHDDWGLERRVDAASGIFRRWKEDNAQSLSSQTLFRRLSWSTDGAFICSTNCVVKNKNVASTISREGWNVSTARTVAAGAANLVGHKQPVVVSRHCSQLLASKRKPEGGSIASSSEDEDEPNYATLLALGDRHGFVTVWSTRSSRPIFKLQCSETRCTVTDLAWAKVNDSAMVLLVSLLDGHCVALRFGIPDEIGPLLTDTGKARLFKFRYGIDLDGVGGFSNRRLFVGDSSRPKFIENALQMSLENRLVSDSAANENGRTTAGGDVGNKNGDAEPMELSANSSSVIAMQQESQSKGKKRVRPVLMSVGDEQGQQKKRTDEEAGDKDDTTNGQNEKEVDPIEKAAILAEKAASATDGIARQKVDSTTTLDRASPEKNVPGQHVLNAPRHLSTSSVTNSVSLPHNKCKLQSVELPIRSSTATGVAKNRIIVNCANTFRVPLGSKGQSIQCIDVSISHEGSVSWKEQIAGTACSALAASHDMLAVGTSDGSIQLYGTSPTLGWLSGTAFRSYPLLVFGHAIVAIQLHDRDAAAGSETKFLDMLVVQADGAFAVFEVIPKFRLRYKGSLIPAMQHMSLGTTGPDANETRMPQLSRIQLTESNKLLLLLSLAAPSSPGHSVVDSPLARNSLRQHVAAAPVSSYGSIQAFVYNLSLELWVRISDGRFVLSDFYTSLPLVMSLSSSNSDGSDGVLSRIDDAVRMGALDSSLTPSHRSRANQRIHAGDIYEQCEEKGNYAATRSHCEDRMACALAVGSSSEFKLWLSRYVQTLSLAGHADHLRVLVDMLLGKTQQKLDETREPSPSDSAMEAHWWLSSTPFVLHLDRLSLVKTVVIPEMSKNRALQRLTNELSIEHDLF